MPRDKFLTSLGLCMRAGKLAVGTGAVTEAVKRRQAVLVLFSSDLSENSRGKLLRACRAADTESRTLPYTMSELSDALGKTGEVAVVAVMQRSFLDLLNL